MAARKPLTQRERECLRASRQKARRLFLQACWRRVRFGLLGIGAFAFTAAMAWGLWTGGIARSLERTQQGFWQLTAESGFSVHTMYLEGRSRTPLSGVKQALGIRKGDPILSLSLAEVRERLETLPTVKHASVERQLPDRLYIRLVEREPVAVWQHSGRLTLIDDEGTAMDDLKPEAYRGLPLVTGEGAPQHIEEALAMLSAHPELSKRVSGMVRVADRRWNVRLSGGAEVKLPEHNAASAWDRFAELLQNHKLPEHGFRSVDLRAPDRVYIGLNPVTAKET